MQFCCSSQEEHVLKRHMSSPIEMGSCCSSQEEHVLKRNLIRSMGGEILLLLARGACIETNGVPQLRQI